MKIALLGAPGANKSKVARLTLARMKRLELGQWAVIDGYVEKLQQRTGLPYGEASGFTHNLSVITDRWVREAEAMNKGYNSITCGTIYESIMYSSFGTLFVSPYEAQMVEDQLYYQVMMQALGALESRTLDYDAIFWLPWSQRVAEEHEGTWDAVLNAKLGETLDGFGRYVITLIGTDKQKADRVVEVIRAIHKVKTPPDDEQSV
jgi:hypothetical protein